MRARLSSIDEFQLLTCFQHELWGSKSDRFSDWRLGDCLLLTVNKTLAALAHVSGKPFKSNEKVWDNGTYPFRIPIKFQIIVEPDSRPLILGEIRDVLTSVWGPNYGWGILNQQVLEGDVADKLVSAIKAAPNNIETFRKLLDDKLNEATGQRKSGAKVETKGNSKHAAKQSKELAGSLQPLEFEEQLTPKEATAHHKTQDTLKRLGKSTGCSVWIAANDKNKKFNGKPLSEGTLKELPSLGLSDTAVSGISRIDVLWIQQGAPVCAFEVETTTSIYSGLLRMSDLLALVPALKIKLFIVAPRERQEKFFQELDRPTFRKIGLSDYCRFISIEDLEGLSEKIANLAGITPIVLDNVAVPLEDAVTA